MTYQVFARKYRPQSFLEVIGQEAVVKTLHNAIEHERLHQAYLFSGARGIGKTSLARIFAKSINCEKGPTISPCQTCQSCLDITASKSLDVLEIDGASNTGVDDVRELREQAKYMPTSGSYKVYIIDEVHMLSTSAFNALLKILEEPPAHIIFIFATTEPHKIPITILSRCQRFDLKKLSTTKLIEHLQKICGEEKVKLDDESYHLIAGAGMGSVRDSLSLLDQVISFCGDEPQVDQIRDMLGMADRVLITNMLASLLKGDKDQVLEYAHQVYIQGYDAKIFCEELMKYFRDVMMYLESQDKYLDLSQSEIEMIKNISQGLSTTNLLFQFQILIKGIEDLSRTAFPHLIFETLLLKLIKANEIIPLNQLGNQVYRQSKESFSQSKEVAPKNSDLVSEKKSELKSKSIPSVSEIKKDDISLNQQSWYAFVGKVLNQKPQIGSILETAHPLKIENNHITLGFDENGIYFDMIQDRKDQLIKLAQDFFAEEIIFDFEKIKENEVEIESNLEKRTREEIERKEELTQKTLENPMIKKAQEILGAKVTEVKEL